MATRGDDTALAESVKAIIADQVEFGDVPREITVDDDLWVLGLTSLKWVSIIMETENQFGIEFTDDMLTMATFRSIRSICAAIESVST
jgi:acyl carrier protein